MPLLAILAAGMVSHALSAGFEFLYPLRLVAALAALWVYRRSYGARICASPGADRRWASDVRSLGRGRRPPHPPRRCRRRPWRRCPSRCATLWIACRVIAAVGTVPLAEELAYRGYLMRRLVSPRFETVPLLGGSMAGARRQRAGVRPHARRSVAARHRCRCCLRRARDAHRQARRVHRRARAPPMRCWPPMC